MKAEIRASMDNNDKAMIVPQQGGEIQLSKDELLEVVTICDHLKALKFTYQMPFGFTEQGVAMLASVLKSETAVRVSIRIIDAFVAMRRFLSTNAHLFSRIT